MLRGAIASAVLALLLLGANAQNGDACVPLIEAAQGAGLNTLLAALQAANLVEAVTADDAALTVFAPTDAAFAGALEALGLALDDLVGDPSLLNEILLYHVLPSPVGSADLVDGEPLTTLLVDSSSCGVDAVTPQIADAVTIVGGETLATVVVADVATCSGIVHVIDFVLLPCPLGAESPAEEFVPASAPVEASPIETVVAPLPAVGPEVTAAAPETETEEACTPLLTAAEGAGLTTLLAALGEAGLVEAATPGDKSLTIFAPSNDAFDAALSALGLTLDQLVADKAQLTEILLYHVLDTPLTAAGFGDGGSWTTLLGESSSCGVADVTVEVTDAVVVRGGESDANVAVADVQTCSGVVHVIDFVLLPCPLRVPVTGEPEPEPTAEGPTTPPPPSVVMVANEAGLTTLVKLVAAAGLVEPIESGDLTILAPTNDAFAAALNSLGITADDLIANKELLREILAYHVIPTPFLAADFGSGVKDVETVLGDESSCGVGTLDVPVDTAGGVTVIGGETSAKVIMADVTVGTTVIHVIDGVLLPCPLATPAPAPTPVHPPPSPRKKVVVVKKAPSKHNFFHFLLYIFG